MLKLFAVNGTPVTVSEKSEMLTKRSKKEGERDGERDGETKSKEKKIIGIEKGSKGKITISLYKLSALRDTQNSKSSQHPDLLNMFKMI